MEICKKEEEQLLKERAVLKKLFNELFKSEFKIYVYDNQFTREDFTDIKKEMKMKYTKLYNECEEVKNLNTRIQIKRTRIWKLQNPNQLHGQVVRRCLFLKESHRLRHILL
jgi:hypothetical protein